MKPTFRQRIKDLVKTRYAGNSSKAALDIGIEHTTLWYYLNGRRQTISLKTFAHICEWAKIDPKDVIDEFSK